MRLADVVCLFINSVFDLMQLLDAWCGYVSSMPLIPQIFITRMNDRRQHIGIYLIYGIDYL